MNAVTLPDAVSDLTSAEAGLAGAEWVVPASLSGDEYRPMDDMGFDSPVVIPGQGR